MTPFYENLGDCGAFFDLPPAPDQELDLTLFDEGSELDLDAELGPDLTRWNSGDPAAKDPQ